MPHAILIDSNKVQHSTELWQLKMTVYNNGDLVRETLAKTSLNNQFTYQNDIVCSLNVYFNWWTDIRIVIASGVWLFIVKSITQYFIGFYIRNRLSLSNGKKSTAKIRGKFNLSAFECNIVRNWHLKIE